MSNCMHPAFILEVGLDQSAATHRDLLDALLHEALDPTKASEEAA